MKPNEKRRRSVIAANRFGLGARPSEIESANKHPKKWLIDSLSAITPPADAPTAAQMVQVWAKHKEEKNRIKETEAKRLEEEFSIVTKIKSLLPQKTKEFMDGDRLKPTISPRSYLNKNSALILKHAIMSDDSINWRLLDFFSNHFSVSGNSQGMRFLAPTLDWDAIAPNLMGQFSTMLIAVITHPAMLYYLNNDRSIGPNSEKGKKKSLGLNENLAREILELHTLGVNGGYTQRDVIELAKAITGWSIPKRGEESEVMREDVFIYRESAHEPGKRKVFGKTYPESKVPTEQGKRILEDLAKHPVTAEFVCRKMAQHFVSDNPPEKLVDVMKEAWLKTDGNLKSVVTAMITSDLSWHNKATKYKTPREFMVSSCRAMGMSNLESRKLNASLDHLGQMPYQAGSPSGYADTKADWDGADALYARIEWSAKLAKLQRKYPIDELITNSLDNQLSKHTLETVKRAESQQQAISLLLMSPEFLHR